jgi:electron transfer flavoprotein beta subunit
MNILVCISKAPDTTSKIAFADGNTRFDDNGIQFIVNPYDEWYALVRALELKEANGGTVATVSVGDVSYDPIIRKALAIGADSAVRIDGQPLDSLHVAKEIANYAADKGFDLILCGKETINFNGALVGGMIAELMGVPFVSQATKLEMSGNQASLSCDVQGGSEHITVDGPFVLSAAKGMAEQRIPNMRGIMQARTKALEVVPASSSSAHTNVVGYELPPAKAECKFIDPENAGELIQLLQNEAKVL